MTCDFVIEANRVVADADGARRGEFGFDGGRKSMLGHAALKTGLRQDTGEQARLGIGQVVRRGLAVKHQRLADLVQVFISANAGKLRGPVAARHDAEGFVVMPIESAHGVIALRWLARLR